MDFINSLGLIDQGQKEYLIELAKKVKFKMPSALYRHSTGTLEYAAGLAESNSGTINFFNLGVSSILHDYGKIFSYNELKSIARKNKLNISDFELDCPPLMHGLAGDFLVARDFGINDKKILKSIKFHTIGYCDMILEDKILFISDKIEKNREYEGIEDFRKISRKNIDLCLEEIYKSTIIYVMEKRRSLHPETSKIWNSIYVGGK